jgi:predicted dithiol-disulfide oxidoreductase (DUF899 family)
MSKPRTEHSPVIEVPETAAVPAIVDRTAWQEAVDELRLREKAHTRAGDAVAAARRRLPMTELDPAIPLVGADGPVTLLDVFEGRRQLIAYHMWHAGKPAEESSAPAARSSTARSASSRICSPATSRTRRSARGPTT